jgi:hypothetical protein
VVGSVPPARVVLDVAGVVLEVTGLVEEIEVVLEAIAGLVDEVAILAPPHPATTRTAASRETTMNSKDLVFIAFALFIFIAVIKFHPYTIDSENPVLA